MHPPCLPLNGPFFAAVDKDVLRINVETSQEQKEEKEEEGRKWHR